MGMNPGSAGFALPPAEDDQVRKLRDVERTARENAAARTLEASTIGKGGLLVKDGGSITVEAPGTINLQGGAFSAATISATSTISTPGTVQGGAVNATGSVSAVNVIASGQVYSTTPVVSPGSRAHVVSLNYATCWINGDGTFGISPSSIRFKTDIEQWAPDISRLLLLRAVLFRYDPAVFVSMDAEAPKQLGFIAEELDALGFPEFVFYDADGVIEGINYDRITVALLVLAQWQEARLQSMEARLDAAGL